MGKTKTVTSKTFTFADKPGESFKLALGGELSPVTLAYESYGTLNEQRNNAILLFHALSGSQHAAGHNPTGPEDVPYWTSECQMGWWEDFIGPGKALDTNRYFVICANYLGGAYGSTAPRTINATTGKPYGGSFPYIALEDVTNSQMHLLDHLGIEVLLAAVGGSIGGMLALDLATRYPERVRCVIPIATGARATTLQKLHNFEQIFAIEEDTNFNRGDYYDGDPPRKGLQLARMIGHKNFVSIEVLEQRARGEIIQDEDDFKGYKMQHQIESYMLHQGKKFVKRFDANSYLCVMGMWSAFDMSARTNGDLAKVFAPCRNQRFLLFSISGDVCFFPDEQQEIYEALMANEIKCHYITVHSDKGHDSFLLEPELYSPQMKFALEKTWNEMNKD